MNIFKLTATAGVVGLLFGVQPILGQVLEPDAVAWQQLRFGTSKLLGGITSDIELRATSADAVRPVLMRSPQGAGIQPTGPQVYELALRGEVKHALLSASETGSAWFDPRTGAAFQRIRTRAGSKPNEKKYRFTDAGVYRLRKKPGDAAAVKLGPAAWTEQKESFYPFTPLAAGCTNVTDAAVLLYFISAGATAGPNQTLCVFSKSDLFNVRLRAHGAEVVSVDYVETAAGVSSPRRGEVQALRYQIDVETGLSSNPDARFQFLGLEGDIQILVDAETRVPIQVRGAISGVGQVALNLLALTRR